MIKLGLLISVIEAIIIAKTTGNTRNSYRRARGKWKLEEMKLSK
jgi:hypothetical protein